MQGLLELVGERRGNTERDSLFADFAGAQTGECHVVGTDSLALVEEAMPGRDDSKSQRAGGLADLPVLAYPCHEEAVLVAGVQVSGGN